MRFSWIFLLFVAFAGCGIKGPPKPPIEKPPLTPPPGAPQTPTPMTQTPDAGCRSCMGEPGTP